jgi:hypothetical protein
MIRAHQPGSQRSDPKSGGTANSSRSIASAERTCQGLSFHTARARIGKPPASISSPIYPLNDC